MRISLFSCVALVFVSGAFGKDITVSPASLEGIQSALNSAAMGDTIKLLAGRYSGDINCDLQINQSISLVGTEGASKTVIDCNRQSRCVTIFGGEFVQVSVTGITFTNGGVQSSTTRNSPRITSRWLPIRRKQRRRLILSFSVNIFISDAGKLEEEYTLTKNFKSRVRRDSKPTRSSRRDTNAVAQRQFTSNSLPSSDFGGCILVADGPVVVFSDVNINRCIASNGGGIGAVKSRIVITDSVLAQNGMDAATSTLRGGGAYFLDCDAVTIKRSVFSSNFFNMAQRMNPTISGTGLCIRSSTGDSKSPISTVWIEDVSFVNNSMRSFGSGKTRGAGIFLGNNVNTTMRSVAFDGNLIETYGSGDLNGAGLCANSIIALLMSNVSATENVLLGHGDANVVGAAVSILFSSFLQVTSLRISNNTIIAHGNNDASYGAGVAIDSVRNVSLSGSISFLFNTLTQYGNGGCTSTAMMISECPNIQVSTTTSMLFDSNTMKNWGNGIAFGTFYIQSTAGNITMNTLIVRNNTIATSANRLASGAGLYFKDCRNSTMAANSLQVTGNSILFSLPELPPSSITATPYWVAETDNSMHCTALTAVHSSVGKLSDGSAGDYSSNMDCTWILTVDSDIIKKTFSRFNISFLRFDLEGTSGCSNDYLSLYDGFSTSFPLIGTYCGNGYCSKGRCPPLQSILSSGTSVTAVFHSDQAENGAGFLFQWSTVPWEGYDEGDIGLIPDLSQSPAYIGAGIAIDGSSVCIQGSTVLIYGNQASHPIHASGAGIAVFYNGVLTLSSSTIVINENKVVGSIATGGAMAALEKGRIVIVNSGTVLSITSNSAHATGKCIVSPVDGAIRCAASYGGAISASVGGSISIATQKSIISNNRVDCLGSSCTAQGGGGALLRNGLSVYANGIVCNNNTVSCTDSSGCVLGYGGCWYGSDGITAFSNNTVISNNRVEGTGGGGGIAAAATAITMMQNVTVRNNTAAEGGGMIVFGQSVVSVKESIFSNNNALSVAGGIAATQDSALSLINTQLVDNTAKSKASALLTFNDNARAKYYLSGLSISIRELGSACIMLGRVHMHPAIAATCNWPGSVFQQEYKNGEYFSLSCIACGPGTYALEVASTLHIPLRQCLACPSGGSCLGSSISSNGLTALKNYWGVADQNGEVSFHRCPEGFCCNSGSADCEYNYCSGNRVGKLCGQCPEGFGLRYLSDACAPNSSCHQSQWLVVLVLLALGALVLFTLTTANNESTGLLSVLMFFYQMLAIVKSSPWQIAGFSDMVAIADTIANLSPSTGQSSSFSGLCLMESMTAVQKLGGKYMFIGIAIGMFVVLFCGHFISYHFAKLVKNELARPCKKKYFAAFIRFLTIIFTMTIMIPLQMLQCVYIGGESVWIWDASVGCYQNWQIGAIFVIAILGTVPLLTIVLMWKKWKDPELLNESEIAIRNVLKNGFRNEKRWYLGFTLYRRFLFVLAFTVIANSNWKSIAVMTLCVISLVIHLIALPFENPITNKAEVISLTALTLISAISTIELFNNQTGNNDGAGSMELLQFLLAIMPILACVVGTAKMSMNTSKEKEDHVVPSCEQCQVLACNEEPTKETKENWITMDVFDSDHQDYQFC